MLVHPNNKVIFYINFIKFPKLLPITRGAPDLKFSNPAGTGFTGFGQKFGPEFRPDLPDLR
jgi:hypothetical protein